MAKKFKDYYDADCAKLLAEKISTVYPKFNQKRFVGDITKQIKDKEFLERQDIFVTAFETYLSQDYTKDLKIFEKIIGNELNTTTGMFIYGWWLWPIGRYVEKHATKDFDSSIEFIYLLTKRFTGEFAIRPLLFANRKKTLKIMLKWSKDKNVHVRRLASEGIRIRLPWAKKSLVALEEFETYKKILSNLKNDPEKFVQKSVGNNLNDLMKENPSKAHEIIDEWKRESLTKETQWIIKHGLRSLRK